MFEGDAGLHVGTSSWSEKSWLGTFYPKGTAPREFIRHYAKQYDAVELDASFYAIPSRSVVKGWCEKTPETFRFAAKMPNTVTHEHVLEGVAIDDAKIFLETIAELGPRLGPVLLQFPYFNKKKFESEKPFFERLDRFLSAIDTGVRMSVEVRNPRWVGSELSNLCREHDVSLAWTEHTWMLQADEWPTRTGGPTTDFQYIRLLGDYKGMEERTDKWDTVLVDQTDLTKKWSEIIETVRAAGADAWVFFNNHFAGHAPASIEMFREVMRGETPTSGKVREQGELFDE